MTQIFTSNSSAAPSSEKRNFTGLSFPSKKHSNDSPTGNSSGNNNHFPTKLKNFFRINSSGAGNGNNSNDSAGGNPKTESKSTFRQSRFLPTIGRNRSTTVASEGNALEEGMSPTAHANPYFAHQGHPALRHHNEGSVPSSPSDTPELQVEGVKAQEQATTVGKEELARKLRRVASAPNAQGLFAGDKGDERPKTADLGKEPLVEHGHSQELSLVDRGDGATITKAASLSPDDLPKPGQIRDASSFRRTYSSNSIKVRNVEVGPGSFDKLKLIGKGDVGKVYLVREKKSTRLYAMKGMPPDVFVSTPLRLVLTAF